MKLKTKPAATKLATPADKVRTIRDRDAETTPRTKAAPEIDPKVKKLLLASIAERESGRMAKNEAAKRETAAYKAVDTIMADNEIKAVGGRVVIDGKNYDVSANVVDKTKKVLDIDKLQKLVNPKIWKKCLVAQVGLVEQYAGKNVVAEATTETKDGTKLEIDSTLIPDKKAK